MTTLAEAAARERDLRAEHYPAQVAAGDLSAEEAQADYEAWVAVAANMAGERADWDWTWAEVELATGRALIRREEACKAEPGNNALAARRDLVAAIHSEVKAKRDLIDDLNARLRARARETKAA